MYEKGDKKSETMANHFIQSIKDTKFKNRFNVYEHPELKSLLIDALNLHKNYTYIVLHNFKIINEQFNDNA